MDKHYEIAFSELLELMRLDKEVKLNFASKKGEKSIFELGGNQFNVYRDLVGTNEGRAAKKIEQIAANLISELDLLQFEINREEIYQTRDFRIVKKDDAEKTGIIFTTFSRSGEYYRKLTDGKYDVDALQLIILTIPDEQAYQWDFCEFNEFNRNAGVKIERKTLKEFWEEYFGETEFLKLLSQVNSFNEKAKEIVGFSTVVTPTDGAIQKFKIELEKELREYSYEELVPRDIYSPQVSIMVENYLTQGLWRAMLGSSNFSLSFVTSEWFYRMYILTEALDLTSIITGYLKSIEQLLFEIIKIYKNKGITVKTKAGIQKYSDVPEEIVDTTLYALENVVRENNMLMVNEYAKRYLLREIDEWREKYRNKYFHKENLQSIEKLEEIRERVIYLYFLILGSCRIEKNEQYMLGIE